MRSKDYKKSLDGTTHKVWVVEDCLQKGIYEEEVYFHHHEPPFDTMGPVAYATSLDQRAGYYVGYEHRDWVRTLDEALEHMYRKGVDRLVDISRELKMLTAAQKELKTLLDRLEQLSA